MLAIGAMNYSVDGVGRAGGAVVYKWDEVTSEYIQEGSYMTGKAEGEEFGNSVAISSSGMTLAVGGQGASSRDFSGYGKVYRHEISSICS
mmetsp:Transcript_23354/g.49356  ORF Transcript_23354/g.49356 Transcript_23354/m.49356 type:complete len:90 (-) Transcript_23354:11-280(-)